MSRTFIEAKYTEQMPFVGTRAQRDAVERHARELQISRAEVIRRCIVAHLAVTEPEEGEADG